MSNKSKLETRKSTPYSSPRSKKSGERSLNTTVSLTNSNSLSKEDTSKDFLNIHGENPNAEQDEFETCMETDDLNFLVDESKCRLELYIQELNRFKKKNPNSLEQIEQIQSIIRREKDRYEIYKLFLTAETNTLISDKSTLQSVISKQSIQSDVSSFSFLQGYSNAQTDEQKKLSIDFLKSPFLKGKNRVPLNEQVFKMKK